MCEKIKKSNCIIKIVSILFLHCDCNRIDFSFSNDYKYTNCSYDWIYGNFVEITQKTIARLCEWISNLSDRRVVSMSFRIALITALTLTVIINRYQPFLKLYDESTVV